MHSEYGYTVFLSTERQIHLFVPSREFGLQEKSPDIQPHKNKHINIKRQAHNVQRLSLSLDLREDFHQFGNVCVTHVQKFDGLWNKRSFELVL